MRSPSKILLFIIVCGAFLSGCGRRNLDSGYGIGFVTLTGQAGQFVTYQVMVDSIVLTGKVDGQVTALDTPEIVDFTKLHNVSELWASASIPVDTYTAATITLNYTDAVISVLVNGVPTAATITEVPTTADTTGTAVTTIAVTVTLDPNNPLTLPATYATTAAQRLALDFDLAASNTVTVDAAAGTASVLVAPYFTVATSAADTKPILVRGPLVNSDATIGTYSVYVRPFYDEADSNGTLTMFNSDSTIFTLNGNVYVGANAGVAALSQASAGSTMTMALTTYQPTFTPSATAAIFNTIYVVAGSTLEDFYTDGLEGEVVARNGNTLTLLGSTLHATAAEVVQFNEATAQVILGPGTLVTEDGVDATGLNYNSVAVGQHIVARGELTTNDPVLLNATGTSQTNTGSVRILPSQLWGTLVSATSGSVILDLQAIDSFAVSYFDFAGNGTTAASDPVAASFAVNTGSLALPTGAAAGSSLWIDGYSSPFGSAPPDFLATSLLSESQVPATLRVVYNSTGTSAPFSSLSTSGAVVDLANAALVSADIFVGAEDVSLSTTSASPQIVPDTATPPSQAGLASVYTPIFTVGSNGGGIAEYVAFASWIAALTTDFTAATPSVALAIDARGYYDRTSNTFTASTINVVL